MFNNATLRRKYLTHNVAIQELQVLQIHIKRALALATHFIHREVVTDLY